MSIFDNMKGPRPELRRDPSFGQQPDLKAAKKAHEMIPADYTLRPGQYRNKATGVVSYFCNCSSQPAHLTLRTIERNRANYEVFPPKAEPVKA